MNRMMNAMVKNATVMIPNTRPLSSHAVMTASINISTWVTFLPRVWRHQFGCDKRRKAARGYPRRSLHPVRGGEYGERQRRSIARTSHDAWRTPCRTPRNVHQCAVLRFGGRSCIPIWNIPSATGSPACGLSLGSGSASSASERNERDVCSVGMMCPSRACRIWGTSS